MVIADRLRAEEALDWVRRVHDPAFADWEAHAAWLETDPRNPGAFDDASMAIEVATTGLASPEPRHASPAPTNDNAREPRAAGRRRSAVGIGFGTGIALALAAGVVAVIAVPSLVRDRAQPYLVHTGAGERRSLTLTDGTRIALNGETRVRLDHANPRVASLERGEAFFTIRRDTAHPFAVRAGGATFEDVGTAFDMIHRPGVTEVEVREGAVLFDPSGAAVRLESGQSVRIARNGATVRAVDTAAIGGWRSGRLLYSDASLSDVAGDVARSIGEPVTVDPALAERRFSGVVMIDADRPRMFRRIAAVMNVATQRDARGWRMVMPKR